MEGFNAPRKNHQVFCSFLGGHSFSGELLSIWEDMVPTNTDVFLHVNDYAGKADLCKSYGNQKRKLGVTTHFI